MNIDKLFRTYKIKLLWEGILKSFLFALMASGAAVFVTSLVHHILVKKTPVLLTVLIGICTFAAVFALVFGVFYYPTKRRVASRMDEMGLQERVGTMLEYQNQTGFMVQLQREDAVLHIERSSPKQMKLRSFRRESILSTVTVCLALTMLFLPHDLFEISAEKEIVMDKEQSEIIKDLIENMREEIKNSLLEDDLKEEIDEIIDKLEEDLNKTDSELEQAGKIEDAKEEIKERLEQELTRNAIGEELKKYTLTKPLGVAVCKGNPKGVTAALDVLEKKALIDPYHVEDLSRVIDRVLRDCGVAETDELYRAFADFSEGLKGLDSKSASYADELRAVFDAAEEAINKALEKQAKIEEEKDKMEEIMDNAKEEILGNKDGEKQEGEGEEGEGQEGQEGEQPGEGEGEQPGEGEGEQPGGDKPGKVPGEGEDGKGEGEGTGEDDKGGSGDGGDGESVPGMTEGIYDPFSGSVSYGKVFATYYADYLAACKEGKIPEALQAILDAYFSSLTNTED